ncbi:hypothetical protein KXW98_005379 [Aspergillus fumigatus]|nr:hypothetical protein KXW59_001567 [Aspergillus fumigatus]KAH2242065.1 hypothetical protein KXW14_008227 [Aspergillus fumigatus]KAH2291772.1 hypothetical protein KXV50_004518 [Aspergillus fumigatus]KAH2422607.1 hypothetical protein KXW64_006615 [Aspergillus fumigatus]KAH2543742.1 hypothetical protein KXW97_002513 [Aspergillus fumigatus]
METTTRGRRYNEECFLSVTNGTRKKRRGCDGSPIPSMNECSADRWTYNDYTVGVVCAMGFEMSAVRYMLDDEHPRLPTKQGDSNLYILGELSGHNVVIAWLPGTQGKGAAAIVANNMQRTFASIKWRLLVGIGGGVPSRTHDIRLGDIVVSMPEGPFGGVVQYDLGKDVEDGFTLKGFLLPPPPILRSAVEKFCKNGLALQITNGHQQTRMFSSNQITLMYLIRSHVGDIHYGLIASGDRVMRSAMKRSKTGREIGDILCFEMEAAGIMTEFPCIAIRGISDYADSHKSDIWQNYAAAAAAGCAKELLSYLDPEDRQVQPKLTLQQPLPGGFNLSRGLPGSANISTPREGSPAQRSTILGQHLSSGIPSLSEEQKRMLLDSLKFDQIDARQMTIKKAHTKTCKWLLELKIGNSNLAMQIRGELEEKASGVFMWVVLVVGILNKAYDGGRVRALRQLLRSIPGDLHELFRDILTRDSHNRHELLLCIQWLLFAKQPLKPEELYFAILSGIEPGALTEWDTDVDTIDVIRRFILSSSKGLAEITQSKAPAVQFIHESVRDFLLKENGLCRIWPDLGGNLQGQSHDQLKQCCLTYMNVDVSKHVDLSEPLAKASSTEAANLRESIAKMFPFLEYAVRNVLYHADAAEGSGIAQGDFIRDFQFPYWVQLDNLFEKHEVRRHTQNVRLLYILAEGNLSNLIRVHPSVLSCLDMEGERYKFPFFASLATGSGKAVRTFMQAYAANMPPESRLRALCDKYCQNGSRNPSLRRDFRFSDRRTILSCIAELGDEVIFEFLLETGKFTPDSKDKDGRTPLSWAAAKGNETIVKLLLATNQVDPDSKDKDGRTPLSWAAGQGNETIVKLLLATGQVDPDSKDKDGWTPLSWAVVHGDKVVFKLSPPTCHVDPGSKDKDAAKRSEAIIKLLKPPTVL